MVSMDSTVMKIILINTVLVTPNSLPDLWEVLSPSWSLARVAPLEAWSAVSARSNASPSSSWAQTSSTPPRHSREPPCGRPSPPAFASLSPALAIINLQRCTRRAGDGAAAAACFCATLPPTHHLYLYHLYVVARAVRDRQCCTLHEAVPSVCTTTARCLAFNDECLPSPLPTQPRLLDPCTDTACLPSVRLISSSPPMHTLCSWLREPASTMATTATPCVLPELRLSRLSPPPACCLTPPSPPPLAVAAMGTVATEQLTTLHSEAPLASLGVWSYVHVTSRLLASAVPVHMLSGAEWMWQMAHTRTPSLSAASEQHEDARSVAAPRIHCVCVSHALSTCTRCSSPVLPVRVLCGLLITLISDCTESPPACALSSPPLLAPAALASRTCGDMTSTEQMVHVRIAPRARVKGSASRELTPVTAGTPMPVIRPTTRGGCPATAPIMFGNIWFLFGINVPRSRHPSIPSPDVAVANAQLRMRFCWATSLAPVGLLTQGDMLVDGASAPCPCRLAVALLAPPAVPFAACASIWWYSFTSRAHRDGCVLCMMCDVCVCESDKTAEHKATVYALSLPYDALCFITSCRPTHRLRLSQPPDRLSDCLSSDSRTRLRGIALPVSPLPSMVMIPCEVNVDASTVCPQAYLLPGRLHRCLRMGA